MLYCCGSKDEKGCWSEEVLMKREGEGERAKDRKDARSAAGGHGVAGMPELLPPAGPHQPNPELREPGQVQAFAEDCRGSSLSFESPQRRLCQRAPKLGQIGRSKKVVIEDDELDDVMNNNGPLHISLNLSPVA